jgi:Ser/Thr protein kinase RdoA (MazF antagonist)
VAGDAEILRYLASVDFPSERCATDEPVSDLDGQSVLVTEWIDSVPPHQRREAIRADSGLPRLGELLGRLHSTALEGTAVTRPGGAWHHIADGSPSDELKATSKMLADLDEVGLPEERRAYQSLCDVVQNLDAGRGLPEALVHPDFVLPNVVVSSDGMALVDWAGAGTGPRLWALAFLLYAEGARNLRRVHRVVDGYRRHVTLDDVELSRLDAVMLARPVVLTAWAVGIGRTSPTDALAQVAEARALAETISERARSAFRSGA